jgi:alkylhydroperoxidase family enzyme
MTKKIIARLTDTHPGQSSGRQRQEDPLADVRAAGFTDADIVAIAGLTAQFLFTNFMSNISQPELDFPAVAPVQE